jgi:thiazole synthase ThiGH ThiG subunit
MKRPLAYITAPWSSNETENTANAARYCRAVYEAGYSPICPILFQTTFLKIEIAQEHQDGRDMANELLRRSRILVVCGSEVTDDVQEDIALAKHLRIAATTLEGILTVDGKHSGNKK